MKTILFLVSGGGGSLRYIFQSIKYFHNTYKIIAVIGDRKSNAISFAKNQKIDDYIIPYNQSEPKELELLLNYIKPDIIITTFHKILAISTLKACPSLFINLHYSLLPSFKGLIGMDPVNQAKNLNSKIIGVTTHLVSEKLDAGKILSQASFMPNWSQHDIKLIYDTVFQTGCIVLLSTILSICDYISVLKNDSNSMVINGYKVIFSDSLPVSKKIHSSIYNSINQL